jgi:hypothetical protein
MRLPDTCVAASGKSERRGLRVGLIEVSASQTRLGAWEETWERISQYILAVATEVRTAGQPIIASRLLAKGLAGNTKTCQPVSLRLAAMDYASREVLAHTYQYLIRPFIYYKKPRDAVQEAWESIIQ